MHSTTLFAAATISTAAVAQVIPSANVGQIETAIENIIPTSVANRIPHETQAIDDLASYVTSITAQPQFTVVVSALEAAIPSSVLSKIEDAPESFLLEVATGTAATAYFSAVPTDVLDYVNSVGEQAISILEKDTGLTEVPAGLFPTATAVPYAYPYVGYYGSGAAYPTGGLPSGFVPTGINPTGASPSGFVTGATGGTGVSGSGFPQPTQNGTTFNPAGPSIQPFQGAAAPRQGAIGVAGLLAGVAILFVS